MKHFNEKLRICKNAVMKATGEKVEYAGIEIYPADSVRERIEAFRFVARMSGTYYEMIPELAGKYYPAIDGLCGYLPIMLVEKVGIENLMPEPPEE